MTITAKKAVAAVEALIGAIAVAITSPGANAQPPYPGYAPPLPMGPGAGAAANLGKAAGAAGLAADLLAIVAAMASNRQPSQRYSPGTVEYVPLNPRKNYAAIVPVGRQACYEKYLVELNYDDPSGRKFSRIHGWIITAPVERGCSPPPGPYNVPLFNGSPAVPITSQ
jgi:hypothetical protein